MCWSNEAENTSYGFYCIPDQINAAVIAEYKQQIQVNLTESLTSVELIHLSCAQTDIAMEEEVSWTLVRNGKNLQLPCLIKWCNSLTSF